MNIVSSTSAKRRLLAAMLTAALPLLSMTAVVAPAQAQQYGTPATPAERTYQPVIRGFNVDEVRRLAPGVELNFDVYGTPGGRVYLQIAGAARGLQLNETEPGVYEGVYVIGGRDRITGSSAVTANLRVGNQVTSGVLRESLLRDVGRHEAPRRGDLAIVPRIERFDVRGIEDLRPGNELDFMLRGTPGAKVDMSIAGTRGVFFLPEVRPGEYEGSYVIRRGDRLQRGTAVNANLRINGRVATATLNKPLQLVGAAVPAPQQPGRDVRYCSNCATVEAINVVEVKGDGNYIGTIGGGVLGALAGSQVGGGSGRTAAEVAGALGGAYVGRNIDRQNDRQTRHFEVVIRYTNGGTQTVQYANDPGLRVGEKVRYTDGALTRDN